MKLSIITINYNNKAGLQRTINSVLAQTSKDFEWILIDGGSTDGSKDLLDEYSDYFDCYVSEPDCGIYNAMNKGIRLSHGEYLQFLNSGDSLHDNDTIEKVLPLLLNVDIYVGRINSIGKVNNCFDEQGDFSPEGIIRKLTFTWIPHQASFIRRDSFTSFGFYREDKKIVSDWWFYFQALVIGSATISPIHITVADYDTTGVSSVNRQEAAQEQESLLKEHYVISEYYHFYKDNKEIIQAIKGNRIAFWLFRVYFFLYRKFH